MSNFYDMLEKQEPKKSYEPLSKEDYAKSMKEKKTRLNDISASAIEEVAKSPDNYMQYLNMQAKFSQYSVKNTLLILAQKPEATFLREREVWVEKKCYFKKDERAIQIFKPGSEFQRSDGSLGINYDIVNMFDISQLKQPPLLKQNEYSTADLLKALTYHSPISIALDKENTSHDVMYNPDEKEIKVPQGLSENQLLIGLAREMCYAQIDLHDGFYDREDVSFYAESCAYMIAEKYHISNYDTSFIKDMDQHLQDTDTINQKESLLGGIKAVFENVTTRIDHGLYVQQEKTQARHSEAR